MTNVLQIVRPLDTVESDTIFWLFGFPVNNSTIAIGGIALGIMVVSFFVVRKFSLVPGKTQTVIEMGYEAIENLIFQITGNRKQAENLMPVVGGLFLFILLSNLLGSVPALTNITFDGKALLRIPTADFSTTFALTVGCMLVIHFFSLKDFGLFGYIGRFIKYKEVYEGFKKSLFDGMIALVDFCVGFLDIISEFARVASLSLRLFGNMYAGMVLGTVITGIVAWLLPAIFLGLGLMVAVVQTIVFTSLITVYYTLALKPAEET